MPLKENALTKLCAMDMVDPIYGKVTNTKNNSDSNVIRIIETTTVRKEVVLNG